MVLRKLSIFGFKSFAEKIELNFGEGITAIIGPNGCGKSNVVDAIRWVFGEQRASALRGNSMQDVIFSGTQKRSPLNLGEVTLSIENTRKILPIDYAEVAITRRIYRSGESEYLINRVPCRLRDIQDLFRDTGIGSSAYTTIENSMINSILSDKADERRVLFEEAAGIGKYKHRRKESLRQLEKTGQDLLRIGDKVQERDRYVKMLARQVEKAQRYKKYFDDLRSLEVGFENRRYLTIRTGMADRGKQIGAMEQEQNIIKAQVATLESRIEKMRLAAMEKEQELELSSRTVKEAQEKIVKIEMGMQVGNTNLVHQRQSVQRLDKEAATLDSTVESKTTFKLQIEKSVVDFESQLIQYKEKIEKARDELGRFDLDLQDLRSQADERSGQQINALSAVGEQRNVLSRLNSGLNSSLELRDRSQREMSTLQSRQQEYRESIDNCRIQLAEAQQTHEKLLVSHQQLSNRIEREDERYQSLIEREKHLEAQISSAKSQLRFLDGLNASYEGYETGVKALLTKKLPGTLGIAGNLFDVTDDSMVSLIERALGSIIQTVVFDTDQAMSDALGFLNSQDAGSSPMVSLDRLSRRGIASPVATVTGAIALRSFVTAQPQYQPVIDTLFGDVYVTDTAQKAMELSATSPRGMVFVSRDGVICLSNGTIIAGQSKKEQAGIIERKRKIESLHKEMERSQREYETVVHDKEICIINRDEAKIALAEVTDKLNKGHRQQQEQETTIKHFESETQNISDRLESLHEEFANTNNRIAELEGSIATTEEALNNALKNREQLDAAVEECKRVLRVKDEERKTIVGHNQNVELEIQGLTNRIASDHQDISRLAREISDHTAKKQQMLEESRKAQAEIVRIEESMVLSQESLTKQRAETTRLEEVRNSVHEGYNAMLLQIEEERATVKSDQSRSEALTTRLHEQQLAQTRDEEENRRIRERIYQAYEIDLESPPENLPTIDEDDASVVENISMLKERLKHVGQVNMAAVEEYETENANLKELIKQRDDLQTAVDELQSAIKKLDREARQQFLDTFEQIKKNFTSMFTSLFAGGEAQIELEENVDPLEAAIHINVRPGGKKMRGIQLLSGGERALTAISLLFSLYLVKPSAYCILDELDAPLDEANIDRFIGILKKFAEQTQFIIITHNKRTMEAADLLYGVTQQELGVSTIVSVKFQELSLAA